MEKTEVIAEVIADCSGTLENVRELHELRQKAILLSRILDNTDDKSDNVSQAKVVRNHMNHKTRQSDTESGGWHTGLKPAVEPEGIQRGKDVIKPPGNGKNLGAVQSINY